MLILDHLEERERLLAHRLARLSDRELADLIMALQQRPSTGRRDARYTSMYIRLARQEIQRRRSSAPSK